MRSLIAAAVLVVLGTQAGAFELKGLTLGAYTTPEQVGEAMGLKCGTGINDSRVCNGPTSIGGIWGDANILISSAGRLQRISFSFDSNAFYSLAEAFEEKYGKHKTKKSIVQNRFGAKFETVDKTWSQKNGLRIEMRENESELGKAVVWFSTPEDRALMKRAQKAERSDM